MTSSYSAPRFGQRRVRAQQWIALLAAPLLTICGAHRGTAATINVTTTQQGVTNNQCSLQEAIYASEFKSNKAVQSTNPDVLYDTGCTAGTGDDIIMLAPAALYAFDHAWEGDGHNIFGPTATPIIFSKITIEGNGATLQWQDRFSPVNSRLFAIGTVNDENFPSGTGHLTLRNVYVKDFHVKGGNGGVGGGGGGLGAGGAIWNEGTLIVENSTFENNGALGGRGHEAPEFGGAGGGGGGGGLSGNGGDGLDYLSAGGGGGSFGNGGSGGSLFDPVSNDGGGGGGGGTLASGGIGQTKAQGQDGGAGGFRCGGAGGSDGDDGHNAPCPGGGGGGGAGWFTSAWFFTWQNGGKGNFGGGGGGGTGDGGDGGFGGGGGGGYANDFHVSGGDGGFGGGGGGTGDSTTWWRRPGKGGHFGGRGDDNGNGGGGGALGGAIFNRSVVQVTRNAVGIVTDVTINGGALQVKNSTFFNNYVARGEGGGGSARNGADAGGAIFSIGQSLEVNGSTFSGNQSTGSGAAIVALRTTEYVKSGYPQPFPQTVPVAIPTAFTLNNTIIANNGAKECFFTSTVNVKGAGNLIMQNGPGTHPFFPCPGVVTTIDPQLQPLQLNSPGNTPTMAILSSSPAVDKADPSTSLSMDQRGVPRPQPQGGASDIGAFEVSSEERTTTAWNPADKAASIDLSNGNLKFALTTNGYYGVRSVASASAGKKYWELRANTIVSPLVLIAEGIVNKDFPTNGGGFNLGSTLDGIGWTGDGRIIVNNAVVTTIQGWQQGNVLSFALDLDNKKIWFRTNAGAWNNNPANDPATNTGGIDISTLAGGPYFAFGQGFSGRDIFAANFGGVTYTHSVPSGFGNW